MTAKILDPISRLVSALFSSPIDLANLRRNASQSQHRRFSHEQQQGQHIREAPHEQAARLLLHIEPLRAHSQHLHA